MQSLLKYKYYDSPEGQDGFHKMFYMSRHAAFIGKQAVLFIPVISPSY